MNFEFFGAGHTFYGGLKLTNDEMSKVTEAVLKVINDELPEEARRFDVIECVLEICKTELCTSKVKLL